MKIGVSASLVRGGRSGIGQYVVQLLAALLRDFPQHEYVVFARPEDWPVFAFAGDAIRLEPVGGSRAAPADDLGWHHLVLPRLARERRLDVLHIPTQRRMLWRKPCALVATVHDAGPLRTPRAAHSRGSCPSSIFRALARRQDMLVTTSAATAREVRERCDLAPDQVLTIPIAVDGARFGSAGGHTTADFVMHRYGLNPPFFLAVGRLDAAVHNQLRLIDAFTRFKTRDPSPWQLALVGEDGPRADEIRRHAARSAFAADIRIVGYVSPLELPDWYRAANAVVSLRRRGGFAHTAMEAMASGVPLIADATAATREICGDAALYCDPDDTARLENCLAKVARDESLRNELGAAGALRAQSRTWGDVAAATVDGYLLARQRFEATAAAPATAPGTASVS